MQDITLGQIETAIIFIATFFTSGGVILGLALKFVKNIINKEIAPYCESMKEEIKVVQDDNKIIHEELRQNSLNTMKNTICNKDIPLSERISVGNEYISRGGNGAVKLLIKEELEPKYLEELRKKGL